MYPSPKNLLVYLLLSIVMYTNNNAYSYTRQDTIWYKDYWDSTEVTIDKSDPNGDCEWAKFLLYGDTVGLEINSIMESIFLTKTRIPVDFSKENIIVKYRIKFAYHYINSHATVNVVFDPPPTNEAWWFDPISDSGCGRFHPPVSANYLCNFGPYGGLGGTAGVDDNPQGENLPRESAPYPQNNEWLDITVEMSQYQIITMAIGEFGYTRYETTSCDLSNLTYITPAFGDQQHTWTVVDKIVVIKETEIQNLLKLQSLYAMPGCEVTVPLIMYNSEEVAGVQFVINFEGNYLTPVSVNLGEHASNMDAPWYNTWDDSMKICILSSSGNTIPAGEGTIVEITFLVDSGVPIGDSTLLSLANVIVSDTSAQEIEFVQEDGWIYFATGMKGDVNRDGRIDILDVVRTINIILGDPATDYELWAADVVPPPHGDDVVNVLDAVGIVCMILHEEISSDTSGVTASIEVGEYYDSGSDKLIPVKLTNFGKIMGMELVFAYDPSVTQINDIKLKDRGDRLTLQYATLGDELRVVIYSAQGNYIPVGSGELLEISINSNVNGAPIVLKNAVIASENAKPVETEIIQNPKVFLSVAPNPVKSSAIIECYTKSEIAGIGIYDISGRCVRVLIPQKLNEGFYTATWDVQDNKGKPVSSGHYFIKLLGKNTVKKITVIR